MKKLLWISAVIILAITLNSCEKQELQIEEQTQDVQNSIDNLTIANLPQISVKSGIIYFNNVDDYLKTINILASMNEDEKNRWEDKIGLISIRRIQNELLDELETLKTSEQQNEFVKTNSKYLEFKEINGETYLDVKFNNPISNAINNGDNMFIIGDTVYKKIDNYIVHGKFNSENIESLKKLNVDNIEQTNLEYYFTNNNQKSSSAHLKSVTNSQNTRKVTFELGYEDHYTGYSYYTNVYYTVIGYKRYFNRWNRYRTVLNQTGISGTMNFPYYTNDLIHGIQLHNKFINFNFNAASNKARQISDWKCLKSQRASFIHDDFINTYGKASSRGVGNNYAVISL